MSVKNKSIDKSNIIDYGKILEDKNKTPEIFSLIKETESSVKRKESMLAASIKNRFEELKNSLNSMTFKVPGQEISPPDFTQRSKSQESS